MSEHAACRSFRVVPKESGWRSSGRFLERTIERQEFCVECGTARAARIRRVTAIQKKANGSGTGLLITADQQNLAARLTVLFQRSRRLRVGSLSKRLGGISVELNLEALAETAPLLLTYKPSGDRLSLEWVETTDAKGLAEIAHPGAATKRSNALSSARAAVASLIHPEARTIADILNSEQAQDFNERVLRTLAALAGLVEQRETRPARAFSTEALGDSKALASIRPSLERLVGPLERLGVRDVGAAVLIGVNGRITFPKHSIDLSSYRYLGLAAQDIERATSLEPPSDGLLLVENLTAFHACIESLASRPVMVVWSGGFPSSGVIRLLRIAAAAKARVRIWCDLDLGGVQIARLINAEVGGTASPVLMDPEIVAAANVVQPLSPEQRARIKRDLELRPSEILSDSLRALLDRASWIEQESLLDHIPQLATM